MWLKAKRLAGLRVVLPVEGPAVVSSRLAVLFGEVGFHRLPRHDVGGIFGVGLETVIQFCLLCRGNFRIVTAFNKAFPKHLCQFRPLICG